jgi:hypothetical protein
MNYLSDEHECYFCGGWCCDTDTELIVWCDVCDKTICFDCQTVVVPEGGSCDVTCIECSRA